MGITWGEKRAEKAGDSHECVKRDRICGEHERK